MFFNLDFHGTTFRVPKPSLFHLFEHKRDLFDATSYEVQSSVPLGIFQVFAEALKTGTQVPVTKETADAISLLAKEFWLEDLLSECSAIQMASKPDIIASLSERISKLEHQMSSQPSAIIAELRGSIADHDLRLQSVDYRVSVIERKLTTAYTVFKSGSPAPISSPAPVAPVSPPIHRNDVEFLLKEAEPLEGIISYLTRKHGGNVHGKGIVTITSKSVNDNPRYATRNVADLTSDSEFFSLGQPRQWICWDFREMRLRPTHYTIKSYQLKSWVVESSLDAEEWTEIDRKTDSEDFKGWETVSFAVSNSAQCRFIRLTQTGNNQSGNNCLYIRGFEFFGTLLQ
jgi:uncharacterized coiled-coil protein SlyX